MSGKRGQYAGAALSAVLAAFVLSPQPGASADTGYLFNDEHFHLTNYVQKGPKARDYIAIMGDKIGRSALFGIPLQQTWDYANSDGFGPTYYLQSDAPLYYYSFTDAYIAMQYLSLPPQERARLDPMITGFNPADMYGVDHIRRVLETFPGVFEGIGEFSIHKEFVSSKVAGNTASLLNPALDKILDFAAETGLLVLVHCDIDTPFDKPDREPVYLTQMRALIKRHPNATIIWAHTGLGRVVAPVAQQASSIPERNKRHVEILADLLADPTLKNLYFDISWDEVAKYVNSSPEVQKRVADLINRFPDRFIFGTDVVAPADQRAQLRVFHLWDAVLAHLTPDARTDLLKKNYERLFDAARIHVRAWEKKNVPEAPAR
ncbi:MAG TPA: amidohydrolase family protein [Rhizomicrobium sp.]|nr:amidohydrolase family protein [Rhizomicrobium sp.]